MPLKKIYNVISGKTQAQAERFIRDVYFGLLHRLPEQSNLDFLSSKIMGGMSYQDVLEAILKSPEFMRKVPPNEFNDFLKLIGSSQESSDTSGFTFSGSSEKYSPSNLIYFCPAIAWPLGGVKVLVRHSEMINSTNLAGFRSEVFFPESQVFNLDWFEHNAKIKRNTNFNIEQDIIIIPEMWALKYGSELINKKIQYAIFVQNGYYIFDEIYKGHAPSLHNLNAIYNQASFIFSISDDTTLCIQEAFKIPRQRIFKLNPSFNSSLFKYENCKKKNIISYMPRKLSQHSSWIINQLSLKTNFDWKVLPIDGASEIDVAEGMRSSKIFLSFSDREGFSMPPLEASLCGNSVIGYTGEGAKEYWREPLFKEIQPGNLRGFLAAIIQETKVLSNLDFLDIDGPQKKEALEILKNEYSSQQEAIRMARIFTTIKSMIFS